MLTLASAGYLAWLAWSIATSRPSGSVETDESSRGFTLAGGFLLGAANPEAYLALASLFGTFAIVDPPDGWHDSALKVALCLTVTAVIDFAWVPVGVTFRRIHLPASAERAVNICMGGAILLSLGIALT